eukprot:m.388838 g.388838  ORF g.388838 m.388838 type:complete len:397 (-) comp56326_c0_seq21:230-1420(-)
MSSRTTTPSLGKRFATSLMNVRAGHQQIGTPRFVRKLMLDDFHPSEHDWVARVCADDVDDAVRLARLSKLIQVAQCSLNYGDFASFTAITLALNSFSLKAQDDVWRQLSKKDKQIFERLVPFLEEPKHLKAYKAALKKKGSAKLPFVPFLCNMLRAFLAATPPLMQKLINFARFRSLAEKVNEVQEAYRLPPPGFTSTPLLLACLSQSLDPTAHTVGSESRQTPAASEMQDEWREPTGNRLGLHDLLTASHSPNNSTRRAARREEGVDQQLGQRHPSPCRTPGSPNAAAARAFLHTHEHAQPPGSLVRSSDSSTSTPSTESPQRSTASDLVPSLSQDESPRMRSTGSPLPFFRSHLATIEPVSLHAVEESRSRGTASPVPRSPLALLKSQTHSTSV